MQKYAYPYLNISIEELTGLMYSEWLHEPQLHEYQEGMKRLAECLTRYPVLYWIQDSTHLIHVPLENQRQALRQMAPAVINSQLKKIARIVALDVSYMAMFDDVVEEEQIKAAYKRVAAPRKTEVQQFQSYEEAAHWIADIKV